MTKRGETQREYTDEELGFIQEHDAWPAWKIADALSRSKSSVTEKRRQLRAGWSRLAPDMWTDDEWDFLRATPHLTAAQVGEILHRPALSVAHQRGQLRSREGLRFDEVTKDAWHVGRRTLIARTCHGCGLLLEAQWFSKLVGKGLGKRQTQCVRCCGKYRTDDDRDKAESRRNSYARYQELTRPRATRHGFDWIDADHVVLANPDLFVVEKALQLGRTYKAVMVACSKWGYASKTGLGDPERDHWAIHGRFGCSTSVAKLSA